VGGQKGRRAVPSLRLPARVARNPGVGWTADARAKVAGALRRDVSYEPVWAGMADRLEFRASEAICGGAMFRALAFL